MLHLIITLFGLIVFNCIVFFELRSIKGERRNSIIICMMLSTTIVLGCKLLSILINIYISFSKPYINIFSGYMFYGGVILSIISILCYCKIRKIDYKVYLNAIIPNLLLLYSIWKIGCLVANCCVGINGFPLQLVESFLCINIYVYVKNVYANLDQVFVICFLFGCIRCCSFLLRDEIELISLIINEIISVAILFVGFKMCQKYKTFNNKLIIV